ncbi:MAG: DinB family protein [Armatimonadetes bacterium]|nr:DinB family protein [Armatimonadota bacterium]
MISLHRRLKARLALVRADLDEAMGRLRDEDLDWAPREGMRTVGGQLTEIAGTERQLLAWLRRQERIPFELANDFGDRAKSIEGMRGALEEVRGETLAYIDSLSEDQLEAPVPMDPLWFESLGQKEVPLGEPIRSLAQHEWYHVGQLVSYLWSRGDDPYKW